MNSEDNNHDRKQHTLEEKLENLNLYKGISQKSMGNKSEGYFRYEGEVDRCPLCCEQFPVSYLEDHIPECELYQNECFTESIVKAENNKEIRSCQFCNFLFSNKEIDEHLTECFAKFKENNTRNKEAYIVSAKDLEETGNLDYMVCTKCEELVSYMEFARHPCNLFQIELSRQLLPDELVNNMQKEALYYVQKEAQKKSSEVIPRLKEKFASLGFNEVVLEKTLRYISLSAPILIHFNPEKVLKFFVNDRFYRNQFETGTSGGTLCRKTRIGWEDKIFDSIYHHSNDFDRVKYGVLNIVNDPRGVKSCSYYGNSYLILKDNMVRFRTSFASGDTSGNVELATLEHYAHVLITFSDSEIKDVISVATGEKKFTSSHNISRYKEVQFHGPLQFNRDFDTLVLNEIYLNDNKIKNLAEEFTKNNNIKLIWMQEQNAK